MNFRDFKFSDLSIPTLEASPTQPGYKSSKPTLKGTGKSVMLQVPLSLLPFGASPPNPEKKILKWSLPIARDEAVGVTRPINKEFFDKMQSLDESLAQFASDNAKMFFGTDKKSYEICWEFLNKTLKWDKNVEKREKYGPRIQPGLMHDDETDTFAQITVTNPKKQPIGVRDVLSKSKGYVTIELTSIYSVAEKAYGWTWATRRIDIVQVDQNQAPEPDRNMYGDCPEIPDEAFMNIVIPESSKRPLTEGGGEVSEVVTQPPPPTVESSIEETTVNKGGKGGGGVKRGKKN